MRYILALFCTASCAFSFTANDGAKTILSDGSASDTASAVTYVDGKNEDGWVLTIGSAGGSYSWASDVNFAITDQTWTVQGASSSNRPTITASNQVNIIGGGPTKTVTVQDIKWRASANIDGLLELFGNVGQIRNYRLTNCEVQNSGGGSRDIFADAYGLIDNCTFPDTGQTASIYCRNGAVGWTGTMTFGTEECVVIENCTWVNDVPDPGLVIQRQCIDGINGFRATIRNNSFTNCQIETHGYTSGAGNEGLQVEAYDNTFLFAGSSEDSADAYLWICRGGTGVIYNNAITFSGGFWNGEKTIKFRAEQPEAYPAPHQPGQGMSALNTLGRVPIYCWNNTKSGSQITSSDFTTQEGTMVVNTDYFVNTAKPGYTALAYPHPLRTGGGGGGVTVNIETLNVENLRIAP